METVILRTCAVCKARLTLDDFLANPSLKLVGMSCTGTSPRDIFFLFLHDILTCGTSIMARAEEFSSHISFSTHMFVPVTESCCGNSCNDPSVLKTCKQDCHLAPYRELFVEMLKAKTSNAGPIDSRRTARDDSPEQGQPFGSGRGTGEQREHVHGTPGQEHSRRKKTVEC